MVHVSRQASTHVVPGARKPTRCCLECRCRACANPQVVLLAAFSRLLSRCYPLLYRPPVLSLLCADETSSAQWTICVPSLQLQTLRREEARKGRCAGGDHVHLQALLLPGRHRASVGGTVPVPSRFLLSTLLMRMKKNATDRFMRDTIRGCYSAERFLLLHHTMNDHRPVFSGNTVFRVFWPWSPFAYNRRRADVMYFVVSEQGLYLEIQFASRSKEEGENW
jgi:hypothetical protein